MKLLVWLIGGVFSLLLVAVLILSAMSMRPGAGRSHSEVEIAAAPAQIWPWLTEGEKAKQWVSWLVEVRSVAKDKEVWVMEDRNNGGERMEVVGTVLKSDFPRSLTVSLESPGFKGQQSYQLTDLGGGRTKVEMASQYKFEQAVSRLLEPVISAAASKKMAADLESLKAVVERTGAAAATR